jgi:hypothetical protein
MASKARAFQQACRARGQAIPFSRPEQSLLSYSTYAPITPFASTCPQISSPKVSSCAAPSLSHRHTRHASTSTSTNSSNNPPRRAITVTSDDGRYNWSELSTSEKAARGTQQTFNFVIIAAGLVGTVRTQSLAFSNPGTQSRKRNDTLTSRGRLRLLHNRLQSRIYYIKNSSPQIPRQSNSTRP